MPSYSGEKSARASLDEAIHTQQASHDLGAPRLAEPGWYRHAHSGLWTDEKEAAAESRAAAKAKRREARKLSRRRELAALVAALPRPVAA